VASQQTNRFGGTVKQKEDRQYDDVLYTDYNPLVNPVDTAGAPNINANPETPITVITLTIVVVVSVSLSLLIYLKKRK